MRYFVLSTLVLLSIFVFVEAQVQMMGPQQLAKQEIEQGMIFLSQLPLLNSSGEDMQ